MKPIKTLLFLLFLGVLSSDLHSQSASQKPSPLVRPFVEMGVDFPQSGSLRRQYQTQSMPYWGFGVQMGHPRSASLVPFVQYSMSTYEIDGATNGTLRTNQFAGGVIIPLCRKETLQYRTRFGYSYSNIKESIQSIDSHSHGFLIGLGVEKSVIQNSRVYVDVTYHYQKSANIGFKDFDMAKLSIGFVLL
jgi:hypothetical protein